jgi:hypothetical protein
MRRRTIWTIVLTLFGLGAAICFLMAITSTVESGKTSTSWAGGFFVCVIVAAVGLVGAYDDNPDDVLMGYVIERCHTPPGWKSLENPMALVHSGVAGYWAEGDYALKLRDPQNPRLTGWIHLENKAVFDLYPVGSYYPSFLRPPDS